MFFRLLALLVVSYVVFLVLAHITQRRPAPASQAIEGFTTPLGVAYPDADAAIVAADDAPLRVSAPVLHGSFASGPKGTLELSFAGCTEETLDVALPTMTANSATTIRT